MFRWMLKFFEIYGVCEKNEKIDDIIELFIFILMKIDDLMEIIL